MKATITAAVIVLVAGIASETTTESVVPAVTHGVLPVRGGPGPDPEPVPDDDGHLIVIYADDPEAGEARCRELEVLEAPAECVVEPLSEQPDPYEPGWAQRFREKWAP